MSPAAEEQRSASSKASKLGGKEFEETFKPQKGMDKNLEDKKGKKKKKSPLGKIILVFIILIVLVGGAGAALYFSGNLDSVFTAIGLPALSGGLTIEDQQAALAEREAALAEKEKSLTSLQEKLDAQQAALDEATSAAEASADANRTFEELLADFTEEKLTELKQVGSIYSKMEATAAAAILTELYEERQIAVIIYYMQPAAAALVLAQLDAALAASVTKIMTS